MCITPAQFYETPWSGADSVLHRYSLINRSAAAQCRLAFLVCVLMLGMICSAQTTATSTTPATPTNPPVPRSQFFAGTVAALTDQQITVTRTLVGHQPDTRTFQLTPKTKMNKANCKPNTKVTVRYQHRPEGDVALQILMHPAKAAAKRP